MTTETVTKKRESNRARKAEIGGSVGAASAAIAGLTAKSGTAGRAVGRISAMVARATSTIRQRMVPFGRGASETLRFRYASVHYSALQDFSSLLYDSAALGVGGSAIAVEGSAIAASGFAAPTVAGVSIMALGALLGVLIDGLSGGLSGGSKARSTPPWKVESPLKSKYNIRSLLEMHAPSSTNGKGTFFFFIIIMFI